MKASVAALAAVAACMIAAAAAADVELRIGAKGTAAKGGTILQVPVWTRCDPDTPPLLEAFLTVQQDVFGDGPIAVGECDGLPHRSLTQVTAQDGVFRRGKAFASGFVLFCDDTGSFCPQAQATRTIIVRRSQRFFYPPQR